MQNLKLLEPLEARFLFATTKFAVIGDYGSAGQPELDVANLVKSWNPDFIVTTGDNNYDTGSAATIDANIGQYYHDYILNYTGGFGAGSPTQRFYPVLGNHDWGNSGTNPTGWFPYRDYFTLPGNERYYDFVAGPVHFYMIDSDPNEPDGIDRNSAQANWLRATMAASTSPHNVVMYHHAGYSSSSSHGSTLSSRWPFSQWGATLTLVGHDHTYERSFAEGIPHIVNGLGGKSLYAFGTPIPESQFRYAGDYGAQLVTADDTTMTLKMYTRTGALVESYTIDLTTKLPVVSIGASATSVAEEGSASFTISRTGSTAAALNVPISIGGTATNGLDYASVPGIVTIPAGQSSVIVPIVGVDDTLGEANETVAISITPTNAQYVLGQDTSASLTLTDDDTGAPETIFSGGSTWKYKDDNVAQTSTWKNAGFNDAAWPSGGARFGYGDPGMVTTINSGPTGNRTITHYFRTSWTPANAGGLVGATLNLLRDDGAVIYLNGSEILRSNMPTGTITHTTLAPSAVGGTDETTFFPNNLDPSLIQTSNTLAVELHQSAITTSDAVFDMFITGVRDNAAPITRSASFTFETEQKIAFNFSEPVTNLASSDLVLTDLATNLTVAGSFNVNIANYAASFAAAPALADGNYRAALPAGSYTDAAGIANVAGLSTEFFVLTGDANRDRIVDTQDFNLLAANFGGASKVFSQGNFDYDAGGNVTSLDFNMLTGNFGKRLALPSEPVGAIASTRPEGIFSPGFGRHEEDDESVLA